MKPAWLNKKISLNTCSKLKHLLREFGVETVCEQAMCPNIGECFEKNQATFIILGKNCTRNCRFCNIANGKPFPVDSEEPYRVAKAAAKLALEHVVITSVTRDDLVDGGARIFHDTILSIRKVLPSITIEVLIPDFQLSFDSIALVLQAGPDIVAHNLETISSLYKFVRQSADYQRSLKVLKVAKGMNKKIKTKSGAMLGLGEDKKEILYEASLVK